MKKKVILLVFVVLISSACSRNIMPRKNNTTPANPIPVIRDNSNEELKIGETYHFKGLVCGYETPTINELSKVSLRAGEEDSATIEEIKGEFAKVNSCNKTAWVLSWYLSKDSKKIEIIHDKPFEMVVNQACNYYQYPSENALQKFPIDKGRIVHIIAEYTDWYCIDMINYDKSYYGDRWIKKSFLSSIEKGNTKEGIIKQGGKIYSREGNAISKKIDSFVIIGEENDMYKIRSMDNWTGMIMKEDFTPNPYEFWRNKLKEDYLERWSKASKIEFCSLAIERQVFYTINKQHVKDFIDIIRDAEIGRAQSLDKSDSYDTRYELKFYLPGGTESACLGDYYLLCELAHETAFDFNWTGDRWVINQDCLVSKNTNLYKEIQALTNK